MISRAQTLWEPLVPTEISAADVMEVLPGFIWRLDRDFRFTYVSDQVADVTGMEAESRIGARFDDLDFIWDRNHDPLEKRAAFRSVGGFGPARGGHRIRLVLSGKPVFEANEGFVGFVGSAIVVDLPDPGIGGTSIPDIGPTSPGASLARDRLDMFRNAVECLTDGFALFDPDDKLIFCNTSFRRMNENTPWKFDGETTFEMIIRSNMRLGLLEEAVGREEMFLAERMARHRAPPEEPRLMRWTDGNVLLVRERRLADGATVVVNTDLTELSKRERALADALRSAEQASRAKSAFLARMSHELRTPLNAIIGFSDLVLSETFGPLGSERYYDYVGDVKRSGEHLLSLINDLLDLTGIESGRREYLFEAHRPRDLVLAALRAVRPIGRQAEIRLRGSAPVTLPRVTVDSRSMHQCLLNLVSNAIKATGPGGRVVIRVEGGGEGVLVFQVSDTGRGMSSDAISRLMTMSAPIAQDYVCEADGAGLGLPITKSLIEIMGGRLEIESRLGEGTRASLIVPIA